MYLWIAVLGGIACFYNSWGIGANDCANSFATSVGAKVLTLRQAIVVAAIFEFLGAFLMGSHVTSTIRKKIVNLDLYQNEPGVLMMGMLCANIAAGVWLHLATYWKLPVSTTHSIIGAILGFSLAYGGKDSVKWDGVWKIMLSWIISPILAGVFALSFYLSMKKFILNKNDAVERTLKLFPVLTLFTFVINTFFIFYKGTPQLDLDELPVWKITIIVVCVSTSISAISWYIYVPYARKKVNGEKYGHLLSVRFCNWLLSIYNSCVNPVLSIMDTDKKKEPEIEMFKIKNHDLSDSNDNDSLSAGNVITRSVSYNEANQNIQIEPIQVPDGNDTISIEENIKNLQNKIQELRYTQKAKKIELLHQNANVADPNVEKLCSSLQVITACFSSFAHGANDVANSIAPFATIYAIHLTNEVNKKNDVPLWILFMGGVGIVIGLSTWGYKIIDRIGKELTKITASRGFLIELSAALTVLIASRAEMPVSTTHCQIGGVFGCGLGDGKKNLQWKLFREIVLSWIITLPAAGFISAALFSFAIYSP